MMRRYKVIDAFSAVPLRGNPVAVVLDATDLNDAQMQAIARWTNLSETTFILPPRHPEADYYVRIFTPDRELPFAGHPTIGSAHAVLEAGICDANRTQLLQECGVGLIPVAIGHGGTAIDLTLKMPTAEQRPLTADEIQELETIIRHPVQKNPAPSVVNVGAVWIVAELSDIDSLLNLSPDFARSAAFERRLGATGLSLYAVGPHGIETRSFAPSCGINEDPVCGSGNGSIAHFRLCAGQIAHGTQYTARQGRKTGRDGHVSVQITPEGILVGGACVTTVNGTLNL